MPRVAGNVIGLLLDRQLRLVLATLDRAVRVDDEGDIQLAGGARPLHRHDHRDAMLPRQSTDTLEQAFLRVLIDGRGRREFGAAIARQVGLGEADDRRAPLGSLGQEAPHRREPLLARRGGTRRGQPNSQCLRHHPLAPFPRNPIRHSCAAYCSSRRIVFPRSSSFAPNRALGAVWQRAREASIGGQYRRVHKPPACACKRAVSSLRFRSRDLSRPVVPAAAALRRW